MKIDKLTQDLAAPNQTDNIDEIDHLVITDIYAASEKITEGVPTKILLDKIQQEMGGRVTYVKKEEILAHVQSHVRSGDLVLFLGAGDIYHLSDDLVKILQKVHV